MNRPEIWRIAEEHGLNGDEVYGPLNAFMELAKKENNLGAYEFLKKHIDHLDKTKEIRRNE